jgi:undecaprenyl-diphosphatase
MPRWLEAGRLSGGELDRRWALSLHRGAARPALRRLLQVCSRLGDGPLWFSAVAALPLFGGPAAWRCAAWLLVVGAVNLLIYTALKRWTCRARPFDGCPGIQACTRALDPFSFPSGHTLHAVSFTLLLSAPYPALAWPLWLFTLLVAASRVVLGLHYPSDVLVGALIGAATAGVARAFL